MKKTTLFWLALALLVGTLVACDQLLPNRLSMENFNKVQKDMHYSEVVKILGEPVDTKTIGVGPLSATTTTWENEKASINIKFLNEKVQLKNYTSKEPKKP